MTESSMSTGDARSESGLAAEWLGLTAVGRALAHELRSPMNGMVLQIELLRADLAAGGGLDRVKTERRVENIERELARLRGSLEDLLAFLSPQSATDRWDVGEVLREIVAVLGPAARQRGVDVMLDGLEQPLPARGDRTRVRGGLLSVLASALEQTGSEPISIDVEADDDEIRIGVCAGSAADRPDGEPTWVERLAALASSSSTYELLPPDRISETRPDDRPGVVLALARESRTVAP